MTTSWRNDSFEVNSGNTSLQFLQVVFSLVQLFLALCVTVDGQAPAALTIMMAANAVAGLYSFFGAPVRL